MSPREELVARTLFRHPPLRATRQGEGCGCGWRSPVEAAQRHQAREVVAALEREDLLRRQGRKLGVCEHGAPDGGRGCIECKLGRQVGRQDDQWTSGTPNTVEGLS